ncbi:MAG: deoxyribose-phosphate aldolase [Candidatus Hydrogenedentales bacterium]
MNRAELAKLIEHTLLRPDATETEVRKLCSEALSHGFRGVSVNPAWTPLCAKLLKDHEVIIDTCIAFPLGASSARIKVEEARDALKNGADEIAMVINIGALKSGYNHYVEKEIATIVKATGGAPVKVILETSCLSKEEKIAACQMSLRAGASAIKTSTGFGAYGAREEDIRLIKETVGIHLDIKAAGGIRTYADVARMIDAGANYIGTSAGVGILDDLGEE